jgi:hypothetical protein
MSELIANGDLTLVSDKGGSITVTSVPSTKVKASGKGVHKKEVAFTITGAVDGGCSQVSPFNGKIPITAQKVITEGDKVSRENDDEDFDIPGILSGGGGCTIKANIKIQSAGQTKASAE